MIFNPMLAGGTGEVAQTCTLTAKVDPGGSYTMLYIAFINADGEFFHMNEGNATCVIKCGTMVSAGGFSSVKWHIETFGNVTELDIFHYRVDGDCSIAILPNN